METSEIIWLIFNIAYLLTIISTILVIVLENRNPTKTVAWIMVLVFLPAIGLIIYFVFGRDNRNQRTVQVDVNSFTQTIFEDLAKHGYNEQLSSNINKVKPEYQNLVKLLEGNNDSMVWGNCEIEVITDGKRKFDALINDLENARHHIHMEYFNFKKDQVGKLIKDILMRKAKEGVEVRFIYENVANIGTLPKYYYEMRQAGVQVLPFSTSKLPWVRRSLNYRNHRKVVVIDGIIGYTGGMNIGNVYADEWRDTHLRILGEGVYGLQHSFLYEWYSSAGKELSNYVDYFPACEKYPDVLLQIDPESPASAFPYLLFAMNEVVNCARNYIYIQTPYYMPSESLLQALQSAALKGVDVRLMVPRKADFIFMDFATQSYYTESLKAGIRIYEYLPTFLHSKTIVSDDYLSVVGTANMDFRSLELSYEINSYIYDKNIAEQNKSIFFEDMKLCREIVLKEWTKRNWWKKILESIFRLFSPLL